MASVNFSVLLSCIIQVFLLSFVQSSIVPLPALPGPYSVGTISLETIDNARLNPYAPTPQPQRLMIFLYYPTTDTHHPFTPYLPANLTIAANQYLGFPAGFLEQIRTQSFTSARLKEIPDIPIIIFSPGLGSSREAYQILLEGLASYEYLIVAMDHTYDAELVEFPDGSLVVGLSINGDAQALDVRTKDTMLVVSQLGNNSFIQQIPGIVHRKLDNNCVAMFGHSLGGAQHSKQWASTTA